MWKKEEEKNYTGHVTCDMWHMICDIWHMTRDMWHVTCDMWHVTCYMLHVTFDTWHVTLDTGQVGAGEPSLKISAPQLLQFGSDGGLKIFSQSITDWVIQLINNKGVCRTAPATPVLLTRRASPISSRMFPIQLHHYTKSAHLWFTTSYHRNFWNTHGISKSYELYLKLFECVSVWKLDGVGPVDNRPSTD